MLLCVHRDVGPHPRPTHPPTGEREGDILLYVHYSISVQSCAVKAAGLLNMRRPVLYYDLVPCSSLPPLPPWSWRALPSFYASSDQICPDVNDGANNCL